MLVGVSASDKLGAVVAEDVDENDAVAQVKGIDHLQRLEHHRQRLLGGHDLGPGQP
jgi:hypothetical protein